MDNNNLVPISISEAARLMAVSPRTVRRLIDRGELAALRIGSALTLRPAALPEPLRGALACGREDRLLTLHDAATRLGCAPVRIRELTEGGTLRSVRVGGSTRWPLSEVDALPNAGDRT